jgi:hypothetical protein
LLHKHSFVIPPRTLTVRSAATLRVSNREALAERKGLDFQATAHAQAKLRVLAACFRASLAIQFPPSAKGAGNAGRPMRPIAPCAMGVVERTRVSQVTPESPGIPHAMVLTGSCALSPVHGLFGHRRPRRLPFANLTPASGCQDHTPSPSASGALVLSTVSVHRIPPRVS